MGKALVLLALLFHIGLSADLVAEGFSMIKKHDYTTARILWAKACDSGNADGCYNLGMMYAYGDGVDTNQIAASRFYLQACNMGNDQACVDFTR